MTATSSKQDDLPSIDYNAALQRALGEISSSDFDAGSTEKYRRPGEYVAPTRTTPVNEVSLSLKEFIERSAQKKTGL
jgi:hypothetical protein